MRSYTMNMAKLRQTVNTTNKVVYTVSAFNIANEEVFFHNVNSRSLKSLIRDLKLSNYTKIFSFIQEQYNGIKSF